MYESAHTHPLLLKSKHADVLIKPKENKLAIHLAYGSEPVSFPVFHFDSDEAAFSFADNNLSYKIWKNRRETRNTAYTSLGSDKKQCFKVVNI